MVNLRTETDLYGYSSWLAKHLNVENKKAQYNWQHMWIWWNIETEDILWALDPNCLRLGVLSQDEHTSSVVSKFTEAIPVGLPFLNFNDNHPIAVKRTDKTLYVSLHSTAWRDVSSHTKQAIKDFTKDNDVTVLLSVKDRHLAKELGVPYELGADTLDADSFYRIQRIFHQYEYMITDRMGSHVLYGLACGMKVGLSAPHNIDTVFSEKAIKHGLEERARSTRNINYLDQEFPGLVIEGGKPSYTCMPTLPKATPERIAELLWS